MASQRGGSPLPFTQNAQLGGPLRTRDCAVLMKKADLIVLPMHKDRLDLLSPIGEQISEIGFAAELVVPRFRNFPSASSSVSYLDELQPLLNGAGAHEMRCRNQCVKVVFAGCKSKAMVSRELQHH